MINSVRHIVIKWVKALHLNEEGVAIIEYALFLPIATMFSLGVIEFGNYFVKNEVANNAVQEVTQTILNNPTYYSSLNSTQLTDVEKSYGSGIINFTATGSYLCVQTFKTSTAAASASACTSTSLTAQNPNSGNTYPYYVVVQASLPKGNITPLGNFVPAVKQIQVTQSSGVQVVGNNVPPICDTPGYFLQYNSSAIPAWQCVGYAQVAGNDCSKPWLNMNYSTSTGWTCPPTNYVIAGGVDNISTSSTAFWSGTSNSYNIAMEYTAQLWTKRGAERTSNWGGMPPQTGAYWTNNSNVPYSTYCDPITFTIPAGLPAGQIIPQGNLVFMGANADSNWHDWAVSFVHTDTGPAPPTTSDYNGSAVLCISSQAQLAAFNAHPPTTESVSWTVTFVPSSR